MSVIGITGTLERGDAQDVGTVPADFAALYRRHKHAVFRLALRYGSGRRAWAEDVVQDVFVAALGDRAFRDAGSEAGAWLYRVTTNRCLTRLQRERVFGVITALLTGTRTAEQRSPERVYAGSQLLTRVERWFDALPAKEKVAFAMHVHDAKSQVQIAEIMGLSRGYVSKLLKRAEAKLQALWEASDA